MKIINNKINKYMYNIINIKINLPARWCLLIQVFAQKGSYLNGKNFCQCCTHMRQINPGAAQNIWTTQVHYEVTQKWLRCSLITNTLHQWQPRIAWKLKNILWETDFGEFMAGFHISLGPSEEREVGHMGWKTVAAPE